MLPSFPCFCLILSIFTVYSPRRASRMEVRLSHHIYIVMLKYDIFGHFVSNWDKNVYVKLQYCLLIYQLLAILSVKLII